MPATLASLIPAGMPSVDPTRDWKTSCRLASVRGSNVSLTAPGATLDGVTMVAGDRILLKDQTAPAENGIYVFVASASALVRAQDADTVIPGDVSAGLKAAVEEGAQNSDTIWQMVTDNPITIGTTALWFTRISPSYDRGLPKDPWLQSSPQVVKLENIARDRIGGQNVLVTGQISMGGGFVIPAGMTISGIACLSGGTGATTPTHQWFCLIRQDTLAVVAVTVNDTTNAWAGSIRKRLALTAAFTPNFDMPVYGGIMVTATTVPQIQGTTSDGTALSQTPKLSARDTTASRTTPVAVGTVLNQGTNLSVIPYFQLD